MTTQPQTPPQPTILITFVNAFSGVKLAQMYLPAVPAPTDDVYLGDLAYEVYNSRWMLTPTGEPELFVRLWPQLNVDEKRPFIYPEEKELWEKWMNSASNTPDEAGER
jgi:hypothetical protein